VNLQFVGRWVDNYTDLDEVVDPAMRQAAKQNAIAASRQNRFSYGLSSQIDKMVQRHA